MQNIDFSTEFVTLRRRIRDGLDQTFTSHENVRVAGRIAALYSSFGVNAERKLFGVVPTGGSSHAHEYRLLFASATPVLDEAQLDDWWQYAAAAMDELVKPDRSHEFSIVSVILAAEQVDRHAQKKLRRLAAERQYEKPLNGWASLRMAAVGLSERKIYTSRTGKPLANILNPALQ